MNQLKIYSKQLLQAIFFWIFITVFFVIIRSYGQEEVLNVQPFDLFDILPELLLSCIFLGISIFFIDIFFKNFVENRVSYFVLILLKSLSYLLLLILGSFLFNLFEDMVEGSITVSLESAFTEFVIDKTTNTFVTYLYFSVAFILNNFFQEINKRFAPGVLSKIFLGKFYTPKEVRRIFIFIDLKSSTTYAEKLGHIKYSELIKDCFNDLAESVTIHKAEIYQYVGDGVVLTWETKTGLLNNNCFKFFFSFKNSINKKKDHYKKKYGFIPEFKAGLNMGEVTITEVGKFKKEIAYHGDAINTAARIQEKCSEFGDELLVSENLQLELKQNTNCIITFKGNIILKGKQNPTKIFALKYSDNL